MPQSMRKRQDGHSLAPLPCLFPEGLAAVISLPADFDLSKRLLDSTAIKIATAFAHVSGWKLIKGSVLGSHGNVRIVAGLHFFQTEPPLLEEWLKESYKSGKFGCKVVLASNRARWTFHPKVLIVKAVEGTDFAIVGSGNLSAGGLRDNLECGLFTEDHSTVVSLEGWFDDLYANEGLAKPLDEAIIRGYWPLYKKYRVRNEVLRHGQSKGLKQLDHAVKSKGEATLKNWRRAVEDGRKLFADPMFNARWQKCNEAVQRIRDCLHYPKFDFGYKEWKEFLKITAFGNLGALNLYRGTIKKRMPRVRSVFRLLTDESKDIRTRLQSVLSGNAKVRGIDMNVITKVLTIHDAGHWPVYNSRAHDVLVREYGYGMPRGLTKTDKYLDYAKMMRELAGATQAKDMWALDILVLDRFQKSPPRRS